MAGVIERVEYLESVTLLLQHDVLLTYPTIACYDRTLQLIQALHLLPLL